MIEGLVTVVIPVYNAGTFLRAAVESIIKQTYQNLEIYIVDDGSTDGCMDSISMLVDPRITIWRQENAGKAVAVNRALDAAKGEFWMVQDADDISYPERVQRQVNAMRADLELAAVFVCIDLIVRDTIFAPQYFGKSKAECQSDVDHLLMPAHDATGMYRFSLLPNTRIDPELRIGEGFDLIMRVGEMHPILLIDGCWYSHRLNPDSLTHRDPVWNIEQVNLAIRKACDRRGAKYENFKQALPKTHRWFKHRDMDTIVMYAVISVRQQKRLGRMGGALNTALYCAKMHPFDYLYYKPLLLFATPSLISEAYSSFKRSALCRR